MKLKRSILSLSTACALLLAACSAGAPASSAPVTSSSSSQAASQAASSSVREDAPMNLGAFTSETLDGETVDESIFEGHTLTVVNVWATFCGWCVDEMPILSQLADEYAEDGVQVIGIVSDTIAQDGSIDPDQVALAQDIALQGNAEYPNLVLSEDLMNLGFANLPAVPATFFFDGNGNMVGKGFLGAQDEAGWRSYIEERLPMAQTQMEEAQG